MSADSPTSLNPTELLRRIENMIRFGTVAQVRTARPARVRVKTGENTTDWLPWCAGRAGHDRTWWAPEVGEQVMVLSPGGDLRAGAAYPAAYSDSHPQNAESADVARATFKDGTVIEYDRSVNVLRVHSPKLITLVASSQIVLDSDVYITGKLHVSKDIHSSRKIMGAAGVWPPVPLVVPPLQRNQADQGIAP